MGFKVTIEASETIELGLQAVQKVIFDTDTPDDSNARSTDLGMTITVVGKILTPVNGGVADTSVKLAKWALVPSESIDCYGKVTVEVLAGNKVVRQIVLDTAYVVDYREIFNDSAGVGIFELVVRQKKDLNDKVEYKGGFSA